MGGGDLDTIGYSMGMTETDNWKSKIYNGSTSATVTNKSGNEMTNNRPFVPAASFSGGAKDNNTLTTSQFDKCVNTSIQHRLGRYTDTTAGNVSGLFGSTAATIANITQLKNIMKEVNEPNEFELFSHDLQHPFYWIFKIEGVRLKTLYSELVDLRKPTARFDVFINGLFISENDYIFEQKGNDFYLKFIRERFPILDRFDNPYEIDDTDEVKINGDVEKFI